MRRYVKVTVRKSRRGKHSTWWVDVPMRGIDGASCYPFEDFEMARKFISGEINVDDAQRAWERFMHRTQFVGVR